MSVEMSGQKIYSEQSLDYVVEIILFEVIVLHHSANPVSHTQPREEEAVVFTPAKPQRGLVLLLSCLMHFGKEEEKEACVLF